MDIRVLVTCLLGFSVISFVSSANKVRITKQDFTDLGGSDICGWTAAQKASTCGRIPGIGDHPTGDCQNTKIQFTDGDAFYDILICEDDGGTIFGCAYSAHGGYVLVDYVAAFKACT